MGRGVSGHGLWYGPASEGKKKKKLTPFIYMGSLKKGPIIIYFCYQYELVYAQYIYPIFQ